MLPPVIERELRVALLRRGAREQWMTAAWTAGAITLYFLLTAGLGNSRSAGHTVFNVLFALGILRVLSQGFRLTADLFSEERRNGTLGLIILTGMKPVEIFTSKLLGAVLLCVYGLLGALPFFALPFLVGGVPFAQFAGAVVFLANALLFCIALGLLASVMNREGGMAHATALAFVIALNGAAPLAYWLGNTLRGAGAMSPDWLLSSPAFAATLVWAGLPPPAMNSFLANTAVTFTYSIIALLTAAMLLTRTWRDDAAQRADRKPMGWSRFWQLVSRGSPLWRARLRARWLGINPFCWLAARYRLPATMARLFVVTVAACWLTGVLLLGRDWFTSATAFVTSAILHQGLNLIMAYAAARSLGEERSSNGLESLLTTSLGLTQILDGQRRALAVQFGTVLVFTYVLDALLFLSLAVIGPSRITATVAYLAICAFVLLVWTGLHLFTVGTAMWIGLWTGRPAFAAMKASIVALSLGSLLAMMCSLFVSEIADASPSTSIILIIVLAFAFLCMLGGAGRLSKKLETELRWIAVAPIPARDDPRFKSWDPDKIFPPGR